MMIDIYIKTIIIYMTKFNLIIIIKDYINILILLIIKIVL